MDALLADAQHRTLTTQEPGDECRSPQTRCGAEFDIAAFLIARYFGLRAYDRLFDAHLGLITTGVASAPQMFSALFGISGNYDSELGFCFVRFVVGRLLLALGGYPVFQQEMILANAQKKMDIPCESVQFCVGQTDANKNN